MTTGGTSEQSGDRDTAILLSYLGHSVPEATLASAIQTVGIEGEGFEGAEGYPTRLEAAVAVVLLRSVRDVLPQWAATGEGGVVLGRKNENAAPEAAFRPTHLFTLNWADSSPEISWPTAYYAIRVPQHGVVVVTASADGPDAMGYVDFAIGHFPIDQDLLAGSKHVIVSHWMLRAADGQERWAHLFDQGAVSDTEANHWADEVWSGNGGTPL